MRERERERETERERERDRERERERDKLTGIINNEYVNLNYTTPGRLIIKANWLIDSKNR